LNSYASSLGWTIYRGEATTVAVGSLLFQGLMMQCKSSQSSYRFHFQMLFYSLMELREKEELILEQITYK
jgi:hypothetical protein